MCFFVILFMTVKVNIMSSAAWMLSKTGLLSLWLLVVMLFELISGYEYGIVIDAGSSGSRMRVYQWPQRTERDMVPDIRELYDFKKTPGISSFAGNRLAELDNYMLDFTKRAEDHVPKEKRSKTPIYVMATAGMRLLHKPSASQITDRINKFLLSYKNPFEYEEFNTRILAGEEEGTFAWITTNYLQGFFHDPNTLQSAGILEMGGASTQIAFMHDGDILANKFPVYVSGEIYPLYVHSYLSYGQEHIDRMIKEILYYNVSDRPAGEPVENPCMLEGDELNTTVIGNPVKFLGTGHPAQCVEIIEQIVYKVQDENRCSPEPCGIGTVYQPLIDPNKTFYALSAFRYTLDTVGAVAEDGTFSPADTLERAYTYCSKNLSLVKEETGRTDNFLSTECMMGLYIPILMVKGYGFSNTSRQVKAVTQINGQQIEWSEGALLYENGRRDWTCLIPEPRTASGGTRCTHTVNSVIFFLFYVLIRSNI